MLRFGGTCIGNQLNTQFCLHSNSGIGNVLGLDGKPRPINVERGKEVIDWKRNTGYVKEYLANHFTQIAEGEGWSEERTGLHPNEFIETRRHWFSKSVTHHTNNSVNVLNLVEGEEVVVESPTNAFKSFVVHYAETFIVPASVGEYTITTLWQVCGKRVWNHQGLCEVLTGKWY